MNASGSRINSRQTATPYHNTLFRGQIYRTTYVTTISSPLIGQFSIIHGFPKSLLNIKVNIIISFTNLSGKKARHNFYYPNSSARLFLELSQANLWYINTRPRDGRYLLLFLIKPKIMNVYG